MRRIISVLVAPAVMGVSTALTGAAFADPASDDASCIALDATSRTGPGQENSFGQMVSEETETFHPLGEAISTLAPCKSVEAEGPGGAVITRKITQTGDAQ